MDLITQVLIEISRVQVLVFVRQNPFLMVTPLAVRDLACRLQATPDECWVMIEELIEEGFIEAPRKGVRRYLTAMRLSPLGDGLLQWTDTRTKLFQDPRLGSWNPLLDVH